MMKKKKNKEDVRKIYLENRNETLELFRSSLKEVQFSALKIFNTILEQEEYTRNTSPWVDQEEEKIILGDLIKQAKEIFGDQYDNWYNHCKRDY
jgi:hypothetical protein